MICKILQRPWILLLWICIIGDLVAAQQWPVNLDESLDEKNDALIFRAVVDSMREWELHKTSHRRGKREVSKVCYEDVGCFEDTGPFSYLEMLPSHPKDVGTRFLVYGSRKARSIPMEVPAGDINDKALRAIDLDLPTKVIVHGFGSGCDHIWVYEMRSALMTVHECNIVCVDWGPGSAVPNYVRAAANTRLVGRQLAKLIRSLNVPLHKVHLIGFSLGAHVAGFAGAELGNVSRITGLDPAGPLFESQDPRARLDATDANFVDVIHSNGEQLLLGGLGSWQPMGDVDFYPNGGRMQTGCSNLFLGAVSDIIWSSAVEGRSLCNHRRAYKLFTDSVSPKCRFPAFPCSHGYDGLIKGECFPCDANGIDRPCGDMGYYSNESPARGQLYLVTRDEEPFCAHQYQLKVYNSNSERPARNYGKLQMTLVGDSGFNETFAMTRKDEELLVGAILQKIVVPHPTITNVEAIEIKYTAYSGWISSGLVTWSIDKVAVLDSFGETLSTCKRSLILESGRPVYLPLYSGDCTVPLESDNSTSSSPALERLIQVDKPGGIGPFTKDQNYEAKERTYTFEVYPSDRSTSPKGLGPFTKEQNLRIVEGKESAESVGTYEPSENRRDTSNPWTIVDISSDGDSNSLENSESERGRSFSGSNFVQRAAQSTDSSAESTTLYLPEIKEPVLRLSKKETGRSLRLPEITEPILRPRATRQNARNDEVAREKNPDEIREPSLLSSRAFTVQLLPERLAGFLAQAERYARETLIPLISEYTPSFGSLRHEEPKYFPRFSEIVQADGSSRETIESRELGSEREHVDEETDGQSELGDMNRNDQAQSASDMSRSSEEQISGEGERIDKAIIVEAVYPESNQDDVEPVRLLSTKETSETSKNGGWLPISVESTSTLSTVQPTLRRDANVSRSLDWSRTSKESSTDNWSSQAQAMNSDVEAVTETNEKSQNTSTLADSKEQVIELTTPISQKEATNGTSDKNETNVTSKVEVDRKFIPLTTFENSSGFSVSNTTKNILESYSSTVGYNSHIQKIPRPVVAKVSTARTPTRRAMMFPYAYERKKDPRTRYIPLIPEEDMGRTHSPIEKDR